MVLPKYIAKILLLLVVANFKIQGQCTNTSVPYNCTFSSLTANNQLPSCWVASDLGGKCLTYSGSSSHASFSYTAASNYFISNGIMLYSGITYSTGLRYYGVAPSTPNFSILSISIGSNQAIGGMTTLTSTSTFNFVGYSILSNTFSVMTSGIFFFAISADGKTTPTPPYSDLDWTNFFVNIPCSVAANVPTVNINSSNYTVCAGEIFSLTLTGAHVYSTGPPSATLTLNTSNTLSTIGTNTITGCSATGTTYINVLSLPQYTALASPSTVCNGGEVILMVQGPSISSYSWSTGSTSANTIISPSVSSIYTVEVTGNNKCKSTHTVNVVVENCTSIFKNEPGTEMFKIFPSPTKTNLNFRLNGELDGSAEVIITNVEGNKLLDQWINLDFFKPFSVDVSNYVPGVYLVSIYFRNSKVQTQSIVIQK